RAVAARRLHAGATGAAESDGRARHPTALVVIASGENAAGTDDAAPVVREPPAEPRPPTRRRRRRELIEDGRALKRGLVERLRQRLVLPFRRRLAEPRIADLCHRPSLAQIRPA